MSRRNHWTTFMDRPTTYVLIGAFLVVLGVASQNVSAQERSGEIFLTLKGTLLLIQLQVPESAAPLIDNQGESQSAKATRLAEILKYTQRLFQPPPEAGCIRRQTEAAVTEPSAVVANGFLSAPIQSRWALLRLLCLIYLIWTQFMQSRCPAANNS